MRRRGEGRKERKGDLAGMEWGCKGMGYLVLCGVMMAKVLRFGYRALGPEP